MAARIRRVWPKILRRRGFDVLVAHSPAYKIGDADDLPHTGYQCFVKLLDRYKPQFFLHGHVHATYGGNYKRERNYKDHTTIINAYERFVFEIPDGDAGDDLYTRYKKWRWEHFRK